MLCRLLRCTFQPMVALINHLLIYLLTYLHLLEDGPTLPVGLHCFPVAVNLVMNLILMASCLFILCEF